MIGSDLIRDLNIKKTFIVVDKVKEFPIELIKISIKCSIEDCDYKTLTKSQYQDMIEEFIKILKVTFKGKTDKILQIGVSPEYRIDSNWATSIFNFRFIILGRNIIEMEPKILKSSKGMLVYILNPLIIERIYFLNYIQRLCSMRF
jgi:hypothetical protein